MDNYINKNSVIPYYSQLADILRDQILSGDRERDSLLPSEREICEQYQVSRSTVRLAIQMLKEEGYVKKERGIGTRVIRADKLEQDLLGYHNFDLQMLASGHEGRASVLGTMILQGGGRVQRMLNLSKESKIFKVVRLRIVDNNPIFLEKIYLPMEILPRLEDLDFTSTNIFQRILSEKYGIQLGDAKLFLEPVLLDDEERKTLEVSQERMPGMLLERVSYDNHGKAVVLTKRLFRGDRCRHMITIKAE